MNMCRKGENTVKMLLRYLRPSFRVMSFGLTVKVLATLLELMLP